MGAAERLFMAIDGEGGGVNRRGQQHYRLLAAGPQRRPDGSPYQLYTGRPLTTEQCLEFICSLPAGPILTGFAFGYDVTMILRDLPKERLTNPATRGVFDRREPGEGSPYTWYTGPVSGARYGIEYLPRNYLRIARMDERWRAIKHSARTVWETFGFFQASFIKTLDRFGITAHRELIAENKQARDSFARITRQIIRYNQLECELLGEIMGQFRSVCYEVGMRPQSWSGPGKLASHQHKAHATPVRGQIEVWVRKDIREAAKLAYYGGRFEVIRIGDIEGPVYEYDINSAYPHAMLSLPCLRHGKWEKQPPERSQDGGLYLAQVQFEHPDDATFCGLPIRQKDGRLYWPRKGAGTYWSCEIEAARRLGATLTFHRLWAYRCRCNCQPFAWVADLYRQRLALGKDLRGYPIKLALNSLYGKLAQRVGNPRYANAIWAGLITATTRAALIDAAREHPADVCMFATDALFSKVPLSLPIGSELGQWQEEQRDGLFIVQPGIYASGDKLKTRGVSGSIFAPHLERFRRDWRLYCAARDHLPPPSTYIPLKLFIGLRLALARGHLEQAGSWRWEGYDGRHSHLWEWDAKRERYRWTGKGEPREAPPKGREISFAWVRKRHPEPVFETKRCVLTRPWDGDIDVFSAPYTDDIAADFDLSRLELDDQPDGLELSLEA